MKKSDNRFKKYYRKKILKNKQVQAVFTEVFISAVSVFLLTARYIMNKKYKRICLEMAKIDYDINMQYYKKIKNNKRLKFSSAKKEIKYRYKLYLKINKGKPIRQLEQEKISLICKLGSLKK